MKMKSLMAILWIASFGCAQNSGSGKGDSSGGSAGSVKEQLIAVAHDSSSCVSVGHGRYYPDLSNLVFQDSVTIDKGSSLSTSISLIVEGIQIWAYTDGQTRCSSYEKQNAEVCALAGCEGDHLAVSLGGTVDGRALQKKFGISVTSTEEIGFTDLTVTTNQTSKRLFKQH